MNPAQPPPTPWASIPDLCRAAGRGYGTEEALVGPTGRWSFAQLAGSATAAAKAFIAAGVQPGDRVAIWAPNSYEWVVSLLGLQSAGGVLVPINTRFKAAEAAYVLNRCRARVLVTVRGFLGVDYPELLAGQDLPHLERTVVADGSRADWSEFLGAGEAVSDADVADRIEAIQPGDVSDIIFTSGTTGAPKGVVSTHGQSLAVFAEWSQLVGLRAGDRYLLINPMFHTFGYKAGILACLMTGATMVPLPVFDAGAALRTIGDERISVVPGPPTLYESLLDHPALASNDLSSLRLAVTGAAVIPVDLVRRVIDDLGAETVVTAYGLTEATGFVTATREGDDLETIATTSGRPIDGVELRIVAADGETRAPDASPLPPGIAGEVVCRGYNVMQGYFEDAEQTAETIDADGWLHTGDIGMVDSAGNLRITDRLKDLFIVGGFNAYPAEIEQLLLGHPDVSQCAVVGVPDDRLGEIGVAFVVPRPGAVVEPAGVVGWAREHMANYKVPRQVHVVDSLPLNASGKVLKFELRRVAAEAVS